MCHYFSPFLSIMEYIHKLKMKTYTLVYIRVFFLCAVEGRLCSRFLYKYCYIKERGMYYIFALRNTYRKTKAYKNHLIVNKAERYQGEEIVQYNYHR